MTMRPRVLTLKGYGSFINETSFTFPVGPGLYFMTGRNEVEPRLGANATGKSTLFNALTWLVHGKDARGMRAGDVANWSMPKGAFVELTFDMETIGSWNGYSVRRTHSPNSWRMINLFDGEWFDLTEGTANPLHEMLRLELSMWLHTVVMAQDAPMFLDMEPGKKAALFSDVMGLDRWVTASDRATMKGKAQQGVVGTLERAISRLEGEQQGQDIRGLEKAVAGWQDERTARLNKLSAEHTHELDELSNCEGMLVQAVKKSKEARDSLALLQTKQADLKRDSDALAAELVSLDKQHAVARVEFEKFCDFKAGDTCPTCGQVVDNEHAAYGEKWYAGADKVDSLGFRMRQSEALLLDAENLRAPLLRAIERCEQKHREHEQQVRTAQTALDRCNHTLDMIERDTERVSKESNPHEQHLVQARTAADRVTSELSAAGARLDDARARLTMLDFWVRGFKDLRLHLISEALESLAIEVNSCVSKHGLVDWKLIFEVDRETKGGTIARGFSVFVKSPYNDRQVPWESWSGGESQRLRVAAQEGLSSLIRERTGASIALEVWDEPTRGMSAQGIADLLDALSERAAVEQRQIWLIDHRSLGYGGFDGTVTIVKDNNGSRIEQ